MVKPITTKEVAKGAHIPEFVFEVVNRLIQAKHTGSSATVYQEDIVNELMAHASKDHIYNSGWLNFEGAYREASWKVVYDKPGYNESYRAHFIFS